VIKLADAAAISLAFFFVGLAFGMHFTSRAWNRLMNESSNRWKQMTDELVQHLVKEIRRH